MRFIRDWAGLLLIFAIGVLTGLITWLAMSPQPTCHLAPSMAGKPHFTQVCSDP